MSAPLVPKHELLESAVAAYRSAGFEAVTAVSRALLDDLTGMEWSDDYAPCLRAARAFWIDGRGSADDLAALRVELWDVVRRHGDTATEEGRKGRLLLCVMYPDPRADHPDLDPAEAIAESTTSTVEFYVAMWQRDAGHRRLHEAVRTRADLARLTVFERVDPALAAEFAAAAVSRPDEPVALVEIHSPGAMHTIYTRRVRMMEERGDVLRGADQFLEVLSRFGVATHLDVLADEDEPGPRWAVALSNDGVVLGILSFEIA